MQCMPRRRGLCSRKAPPLRAGLLVRFVSAPLQTEPAGAGLRFGSSIAVASSGNGSAVSQQGARNAPVLAGREGARKRCRWRPSRRSNSGLCPDDVGASCGRLWARDARPYRTSAVGCWPWKTTYSLTTARRAVVRLSQGINAATRYAQNPPVRACTRGKQNPAAAPRLRRHSRRFCRSSPFSASTEAAAWV